MPFGRCLIAALVAAAGAACTEVPLVVPPSPPAAQPDGAGIGIVLETRPPMGGGMPADAVYFVKTEHAGVPYGEVFVSNHDKQGRIYLLNAPVGDYVAVAGMFSRSYGRYIWYFPEELIERTRVTAIPGRVTFAGSYVVGAATDGTAMGVCPQDADAAQLFYSDLIAPGRPNCGLFAMALHGAATNMAGPAPVLIHNPIRIASDEIVFQYRGTIRSARRGSEDETTFRSRAAGDLLGSGWRTGPD